LDLQSYGFNYGQGGRLRASLLQQLPNISDARLVRLALPPNDGNNFIDQIDCCRDVCAGVV
jgi:hypothetical protein